MDANILSLNFRKNKICKDANINGHECGWLSEKRTLRAADINRFPVCNWKAYMDCLHW